MKYSILILVIAVLLIACASSADNEVSIAYDPELVGDVVLLENARAQAPLGWSALSDSLKQQMFGDPTLHVFALPDMSGLMHIAAVPGDVEVRVAEMRAALEQQAPDGLVYNTFEFKGQTYRQFIIQASGAATYQIFITNTEGRTCAVTYTISQTVFESEIKKIESSIASILLD